MKFAQEIPGGKHVIKAYEPGRLLVNERVLETSVILSAEHLVPDWPPRDFSDLAAAHFDPVLELEPEVVIIGTGARQRFPAPGITAGLIAAGVGFEVMDTAAACRTYNILLAEERRVVAALLMI